MQDAVEPFIYGLSGTLSACLTTRGKKGTRTSVSQTGNELGVPVRCNRIMADRGKDDLDIHFPPFVRTEKHGLYTPDDLEFWKNRHFHPYIPSYGHNSILIWKHNGNRLTISGFVRK